MKKKYEKPIVSFESFALSASIAAGCTYISHHAWEQCVLDAGVFGMIFGSPITGCDTQLSPGLDDKVCYNVPSDTNNVFSS